MNQSLFLDGGKMNNEPVGHLYPEGEGVTVYDIKFAWKVTGTTEPIPLYTHPAKTEDEGKVCARCGAIAFDPVITQTAKTLTDKEIEDIYEEFFEFKPKDKYSFEFARALLRKAQGK